MEIPGHRLELIGVSMCEEVLVVLVEAVEFYLHESEFLFLGNQRAIIDDIVCNFSKVGFELVFWEFFRVEVDDVN